MAIVTCPSCGAKNRVDECRAEALQPLCARCKAKLPAPAAGAQDVVVATDDSFAALLESAGSRPVLVDCWAQWCGPCRMIAPTIDQLAADSAGRYVVAKLNVDENPQVASRFRISSIPALLLFKDGALAQQLVGLQPKAVIAERLARLLQS